MKIYKAIKRDYESYTDIVCDSIETAEKALCELFVEENMRIYNEYSDFKKLQKWLTCNHDVYLMNEINNLLINKEYSKACKIISDNNSTDKFYSSFYIKEYEIVTDSNIEKKTIDPKIFHNIFKELTFI